MIEVFSIIAAIIAWIVCELVSRARKEQKK